MTTVNQNKIEVRLQMVEWQIEDAKRAVQKVAEELKRVADNAEYESQRMVDQLSFSLFWVNELEGKVQKAIEAKTELMNLYTEQKRLRSFLQD
jgi:hypothetical protein